MQFRPDREGFPRGDRRLEAALADSGEAVGDGPVVRNHVKHQAHLYESGHDGVSRKVALERTEGFRKNGRGLKRPRRIFPRGGKNVFEFTFNGVQFGIPLLCLKPYPNSRTNARR